MVVPPTVPHPVLNWYRVLIVKLCCCELEMRAMRPALLIGRSVAVKPTEAVALTLERLLAWRGD
jgi:hypothetical protein